MTGASRSSHGGTGDDGPRGAKKAEDVRLEGPDLPSLLPGQDEAGRAVRGTEIPEESTEFLAGWIAVGAASVLFVIVFIIGMALFH